MPPRRRAKQNNGGCSPTEFRHEAPSGVRVCVAGSFNNWDPYCDQMREDAEGSYRLVLPLPPGKHEYRFVIGDEWRTDPQNPDTVTNAYGSTNCAKTISVRALGGEPNSRCRMSTHVS